MFRRILPFALALSLAFPLGVTRAHGEESSAKFKITGDISVFIDANEAAPVRHAMEDLLSDFKKVFGKFPKVIHQIEEAGAATIIIGRLPSVNSSVNAAESFTISAERKNLSGGTKEVISLNGADLRGTIYAIYQWSS